MKRRWSLLLFLCALLCAYANGQMVGVQNAGAQNTQNQNAGFQNPGFQGESLVIGPGDLLNIQVFDTPELNETARVSDSGDLQLVLGGSIHVSSLTPVQAARAVEKALVAAQVMYAPKVLVTDAQYATQNVTVFGEVVKPGSYSVSTSRSVLDVLALSGGLTLLANRNVVVERHGTSERVHVFISNDPNDTTASKVQVFPGDTVRVTKTDIVYILGDVIKAGGYPIADNRSSLTVLQAVSLAGGTSNAAVPSHARLVRKNPDGSYTETRINVSAMQKGKEADVPLRPDDIIYVPFSYIRNTFLGLTGLLSVASSAAIYAR